MKKKATENAAAENPKLKYFREVVLDIPGFDIRSLERPGVKLIRFTTDPEAPFHASFAMVMPEKGISQVVSLSYCGEQNWSVFVMPYDGKTPVMGGMRFIDFDSLPSFEADWNEVIAALVREPVNLDPLESEDEMFPDPLEPKDEL